MSQTQVHIPPTTLDMLAPFWVLALHVEQDFLAPQYNPLALSEPLLAPVTFSAQVGKHLLYCHLLLVLTFLPSTIQSMTFMEVQKNQNPLCHPLNMHPPTDLQTCQWVVMGAVMNQTQTLIQNQTTQTHTLRWVPLTC
jgi:hypothetical protein